MISNGFGLYKVAVDCYDMLDKTNDTFLKKTNFMLQDNTAATHDFFIKEDNEKFILTIACPGFKSENLKIESKNGALTINGDRKKDDEFSSKLYFSFLFETSKYDDEKIEAQCQDGILKITIPKIVQTSKTIIVK